MDVRGRRNSGGMVTDLPLQSMPDRRALSTLTRTIEPMRSVELFAGAGGLALGCEMAGFRASQVVEWDRWACDTMRENSATGYPLVANWNVCEGDVRDVDWTVVEGPVDLVTGGPPCQPFSMGGKHGAADDPRDMFPATAEVIAALRPRAFIVENVKGLTRAAFQNYFTYILLRLEMPELTAKPGESWYDHLMRLQAEHTTAHYVGLRYNVVPTLVNAADFGVPQQRHRVFIVGFRSDQDAEWSFPDPSHSKDSLLHSQWITGEYWDRHGVARRARPPAPSKSALDKLAALDTSDLLSPWKTVRDALEGLPEPTKKSSPIFPSHIRQDGARQYPGHTGSPVDLPSKALKAGGHGVPGGENMMLKVDGSVRYFTVRESARIQTFPDQYVLHGAWGEAMRQLGNAVPVLLAQRVAGSVRTGLEVAQARETMQAVARRPEIAAP